MSWADKRINEYKGGAQPNFIEKRILEHANPVHFLLALVGGAAVVYGSWNHSVNCIILGALLNLVGHLYCWLQK